MARARKQIKSKPSRKTTAAVDVRNRSFFNQLDNRFKSYWYSYKRTWWFYPTLVAVGLVLLIVARPRWLVAATVNGEPISNLKLQQKLNTQFRSQTLNQLIDETIVKQEASKKGLTVTSAELDQKITQLENNFGGASVLDSLLSQQGLTRKGLKDQLMTQLLMEKLYKDEASVSAEEITKFLQENKDTLKATESAAQEKEARDTLAQQKLARIFREKFQQLKSAAKIKIF